MSVNAQLVEEKAAPSDRTRHVPPGPRYRTIFGYLADFRRAPLQLYTDAAKYGDIVRFHARPMSVYLLTHPDHIKYILQDNYQNYGRVKAHVNLLKPVLGDGLLLSEGEQWRCKRRLAQPAFHRQRIAALASLMTEATVTMLEQWRVTAERGQPLEIVAEMDRLAFMITNKALFSTDVPVDVEERERNRQIVREYLQYRIEHVFAPPYCIPTPRNLRFRKALQASDAFVYAVIAERRRSGQETGDLLSMLLAARDEETGEGMSDKQLRDEVMTFMGAGTETTAVALAWVWYFLSTHPEVDRKLRAELSAVLGDRLPTTEDLPQLKYPQMIFEEAMRLYPPAWINARQAVQRDEIGSYPIPANALVFYCPYVLHRHPSFWENPEGFDPERFAPEHVATRPRYAYLPFGGGPRKCIGNEFALMEAQLVIATVAQHYRLYAVPGHPVVPHPTFSLRPRHGIQMTLHAA